MIKKNYLMSPGPTPLPDAVVASAARPLIHHRTAEFSDIYLKASQGLKEVFGTREDVYILAASGTGAMESAVVNLHSPGDRVLSVDCGKFGARWGAIARANGLEVKEIRVDWGEDLASDRLEAELEASPGIRTVFTTLSETSTGTLYDIRSFAKIAARRDALLVVDGISGVGAHPCPMDEWGVDVLISGSQKSFMTPPGLSFIAFSRKSWERVESARLPRYYFDARAARRSLEKSTSPWTPATSLVIQLKSALDIILGLGLDTLHRHHRILGEATRSGIAALGLDLLSQKPGNALTAVRVPEGLDGKELLRLIQLKYRVFIAGAQDPHRGEFVRIGHLGYTGGFDILTALGALEMALRDLGRTDTIGRALAAAEAILKENWS
jgi:aspartate aminotransferase-like enzyme